MAKARLISVIVPVYNEAESAPLLHQKLKKVLTKHFPKHEIIYIDDGSTDTSIDVLTRISKSDVSTTVIQFRRNFGQTAAISAGFDRASGEVIVTLDADLQNDPKDIPKMVRELHNGFDLVSGWRKARDDDFLRVFFSRIANLIISKTAGVPIHDFGCTLKVYRGDLVKQLKLYGEMHRFIPAIASQVGAKISEIEVRHHPRKYGKSKYGLDRTFRVILDVILVKFLLTFQNKPMQLFGMLGIALNVVGGGIFTWLIYLRLFENQSLSDRPLFLVSITMILIGIQFVTIGVLAEIIVRVYYESQNKKTYYIRQIIE